MSMEDRLNAIGLKPDSEKEDHPPRADSLSVLLSQGLQSNDKDILNVKTNLYYLIVIQSHTIVNNLKLYFIYSCKFVASPPEYEWRVNKEYITPTSVTMRPPSHSRPLHSFEKHAGCVSPVSCFCRPSR